MESFVIEASQATVLLTEAIAVLVVTYGVLEAFSRLLVIVAKRPIQFAAQKAVWRGFGAWLLIGLEFELAADIIQSVTSPTWEDIGELAAIAVIRTFLNYFLERDLEKAGRPEGA